MIPENYRKQLEEIEQVDGHTITPVGKRLFMAGAEAAFELATKAERERVVQIIFDSPNDITRGAIMKEILNPTGCADAQRNGPVGES